MGLTLTTLHIPGDAAAILPLLKAGETLRTHCPGWTTILPGPDTPDRGEQSLQKLAKRIPGACLYFHYFDDDMFQLLLFEGGKRTAALSTCDLMGKSSKVDRISAAIFGDDRATAALKLIAKCTDLEEQLALAEEALGVSLLEDRAYFTGLGADGLLTATKTGKDLLLFDRTGRLVSKHPFKGVASIRNVPVIGGAMYIVEETGDINPFAVEEPEKKLWRLEKL